MKIWQELHWGVCPPESIISQNVPEEKMLKAADLLHLGLSFSSAKWRQ